ncbi:MAG: ATP-binding protein [Steroidobacteraceae bacterium]
MTMSSLRTRLLAWLLGGIAAVGLSGGLVVYHNTLKQADAFFDYHLEQMALLLRDQPVEYLWPLEIPSRAAAYGFVVQVWTIDGQRIWAPPNTVLPDATTLGFSTVTTRQGRWRVYGVASPTRVVQVAQLMRVRRQQAIQLAVRTLVPFALAVPILGILVWFAVGHTLEPLQRLASSVKSRRVGALEPLPHAQLPDEVQPLVAALNDLLGRLSGALGRERAFMADAAHELRTPLTALHLQLGALARAGTDRERAEAMERLSAGVQRSIRLVEQLLALARQEPRADPARGRLALDELVRDVVAELVPLADARRIDLGIAEDQPAVILGERDAIATLVRNLVDNAVRYTPAGGRVDVSLTRAASEEGHVRLKVCDNGPGIAPEERTRVFDRFYRQPGMQAPGSGLGLAIVKAIADAHGAPIELSAGEGGRGLAVTVIFAMAPPA